MHRSKALAVEYASYRQIPYEMTSSSFNLSFVVAVLRNYNFPVDLT